MDWLKRWRKRTSEGTQQVSGPLRSLAAVRQVGTLAHNSKVVTAVAMASDGRIALTGSVDKTVKVWDPVAGECLRTFKGHSQEVWSVALAADHRLAASAGHYGEIRIWDLSTGQVLQTLSMAQSSEVVSSIALTPDNRFLIASKGHTVWLLDVISGRCVRKLKGARPIHSVALTPDGGRAISGGGDTTLRLWNLRTGGCRRTFEGHEFGIWSVAVSQDGRTALSGSDDKTIRVWELATGRCLRTLEAHRGGVWSVAVSQDGRCALSGGSNPPGIRFWDLTSGRCLWTNEDAMVSPSYGVVRSVALSMDGRLVLSTTEFTSAQLGNVDVWEVEWDYELQEPADWDEGARPYLEAFLAAQTPYTAVLSEGHEPSKEELRTALTSRGKPSWMEEDFQRLLRQLQYAGYGWLRPEGVRSELQRMAAKWKGPRPLPFGGSFISLFGRSA